MDIPSPSEFLDHCQAFIVRHRMAPTTFGREAASDPAFIDTLANGRAPGLKLARQVQEFMRAYDSAHPVLSSGEPESKNGRAGQGGFLARMVDAARGIAG